MITLPVVTHHRDRSITIKRIAAGLLYISFFILLNPLLGKIIPNTWVHIAIMLVLFSLAMYAFLYILRHRRGDKMEVIGSFSVSKAGIDYRIPGQTLTLTPPEITAVEFNYGGHGKRWIAFGDYNSITVRYGANDKIEAEIMLRNNREKTLFKEELTALSRRKGIDLTVSNMNATWGNF